MTDHVLSFLSAYQETLSGAFSLPDELKKEYTLFDCLRETQAKSVYLVRNKTDDSFAVLKTASGSAKERLQAEYALLKRLSSPYFPRAISYHTGEHADYFLRSYIEGTPVSAYLEKNGLFSEAEAIRLVCGLCEALNLLHAQTPPIIHRDIKPQNVILTKQRSLALIDFDAARRFQAEQKTDTVFFGTQATAAPEQFGYQQTDQRSDLYSTGILLLYLCTGSYQREECGKIRSRQLRHIIEKSTRFDPARRFRSIESFHRSLLRAQYAAKTSAYFVRGTALGLLLGFGIGASLAFSGAFSGQQETSAPSNSAEALPTTLPAAAERITFESPQIEHAVREQLGLDDKTPLTQDYLDRVTSLYLFGNQTFQYWSDATNNSIYHRDFGQGTLQSLADIQKLRNLTELAVCDQNISDLSALKGLHLSRLALTGNQITDLSVLATIPQLRELFVGNNPLTQIDVLQNLPNLEVVDLSNTKVYDLSPLNKKMTALYLNNTPIFDYSPLLGMASLQTLFFSSPDKDDLAVLSQLTGLTSLEITNEMTSIEPLLPLKNLTRLALIFTPIDSFRGLEALHQLNYFRFAVKDHIDLTTLTNMTSITVLDIFAQNMTDYSALFQIPNLATLYCSKEQEAEIEALGIPLTFTIIGL